ncbi:PIP5K6 [Symbiodinium pilosum]|uniref:PIP5K6 protein n=1 Tax=Symbiodinium pilosum TaxID=2952 RepID=A0A812SMK5_SYMPI|nr:PIP5K6 [Symbiodinium pilosum]
MQRAAQQLDWNIYREIGEGFDTPSAVLKSREARTFDRRSEVLQALSVPRDDTVLHALQIMDAERLTICPATSQELSGDLGGAVAVGVVAVADLKLVFESDEYHVLDYSIDDFLSWRQHVVAEDSAKVVRYRSLRRFNVVSVDHHETLHVLATRLLASKLQRIFLSSNEIARIVGIVSSREILIEVVDQLLHTTSLSSRFDGSLWTSRLDLVMV